MITKEKTVTYRKRKSKFVRLFDKTPKGVICPHFYELILSNGCPYDCKYCYLKLTFRGEKEPNLFTNSWTEVQKELDAIKKGVFSTGELADSLALIPPLLPHAIEYFSNQKDKYLLLLTKSTNIDIFNEFKPSPQIIISFSVNAPAIWKKYELGTPHPLERIKAAEILKEKGWRIRIRLDPIILDYGIGIYKEITLRVKSLQPERVTTGTLRHYPGLFRFAKDAPRKGLMKAEDGRMRYSESVRVFAYSKIAEWLTYEPALCKETVSVWRKLGWKFKGCNCTV